MKKIILLTIILLTFFSCSDKKKLCYVCDKEQKLQISEFVSNNIKSANNMSDEEMEDVISELRNTGIKLYCEQELITTNWNYEVKYSELKKDSLKSYYPYVY